MTLSITQPTVGDSWLEAVLGDVCLSMLTTDGTGKIKMINERACKLLGVDANDTIGQPIGQVLQWKTLSNNATVDFPLSEVLQQGHRLNTNAEWVLQVPGKKPHVVSYTATPLRHEEGDIIGALITITPKTQKNMESFENEAAPILGHETKKEATKAIYVRHNGKYVRVWLDDLLWVEAMENYVSLQTLKEKFVVHSTLKNISDLLAPKGFRRIHRSYVVRTEAIESIEENHVNIQGTVIPIGKSYRTELLDQLTLV
jgi:hypothetical protein